MQFKTENMVTLNLDPTFTPFARTSSGMCAATQFDFSSGFEPHIKLLNRLDDSDVLITCRFKNGNDLMRVLLATDAAKRAGAKSVSLFIPFLPFARQDRPMVEGEPLSVAVFADLINAQGYKRVYLFDPHSDVSPALIKNSFVINNHVFVGNILAAKRNYRLASPDAGAYKKIFRLSTYLGYRMGGQNDIVICDKVRDLNTGRIINTTVNVDDLKGEDVYIIDDILDGGLTFILIAEELKKRNAGDIYLIVSHYIGAKGETELKKYFKNIYTTDSVKDVESDFIVQIKLELLFTPTIF